MALRLFNGFDFLQSPVPGSVWSSLGISFTRDSVGGGLGPGRFGGMALKTNQFHQVLPVPIATGYVGFAYTSDLSQGPAFTGPAITFWDAVANAAQFNVAFQPNGVIAVYRGSQSGAASDTPLAHTGAGAYAAGIWAYYEIKAVIGANSTGSVEVRINTTPVLAADSITTRQTANGHFDVLIFDSALTLYPLIDDLYVCDDAGPAPLNTWLGNVRCQALLPCGPGDSAQFTPSDPARANWQCAGNSLMTDALYVTSATIGDEDSYAVSPMVNTPLVLAVQTRLAARQDDATQRALQAVLNSAGTTVHGAAVNLNQSFAVQTDLFLTDPATGVSWLYPAVNLLKVGQRVAG